MKAIQRISALFALAFVFVAPSVNVTAKAEAAMSGTGYEKAEDVEYKTTGKTVHNWGARDEDCLFLSTYAQNFYVGNYTYEALSQKSGGTKQSDAPNSELYAALKTMMETEHTFYTYYNGSKNVRDYYKYADCVQNDTTQVSLIYRGTMTSSTWNAGNVWNQEHIWPQSKLSTDQQIGDIMHLRPANPSENSERGNTAYGEGNGYYDPDSEGQNIRGDCARMVLYMYVRWGVTSTMWGSSGVIQSADILLKWMEEDPVDTWEMGRNDAVQSVTGTRNVFVDYPEYAWLLFGKDVPSYVTTPSGIAKQPQEECTSHTFGEWSVIREATETEEGLQIRTCEKCGAAERNKIPKLGQEDGCAHNFGEWTIVREATETEEGLRTRSCQECGAVERDKIPKLSSGGEENSRLEQESPAIVGCASSIGVSVIGLAAFTGFVLIAKRKKD